MILILKNYIYCVCMGMAQRAYGGQRRTCGSALLPSSGVQSGGKCFEPLSHFTGSDMNVRLSLSQQSSWGRECAEKSAHESPGQEDT